MNMYIQYTYIKYKFQFYCIIYKSFIRVKQMPKRKEKGTDTEQSDDYEIQNPHDKTVHFGTIQINRFLPPDELPEEDPSKYSIRNWANVLQAQRLLQWKERKNLFERAIKCLPYSYKIWHNYLEQSIDYCSNRSLYSKQYAELNKLFERALTFLPKLPRIWLMYTQSLAKQHLISKARVVYNWSFRNLPLTQHQKIWAKYAPWVLSLDNPKTAKEVIPRYLKLNPDYKQIYAIYLKERNQLNLSAKVLHDILQDDRYNSKQGKSKFDFFMELVTIIITDPNEVTSVNGEELIRNGIKDYPDEAGVLWVKLSDYFIRLGSFEKAREILENALNTIDSAKDFGLIFNAYCKFEEEMINALADPEIRKKQGIVAQDLMDAQIELRLGKLEKLLERRPYLLYNINIRKNSNNVKVWLKLAELYKDKGDSQNCLKTLERATQTIVSYEAENGKYSDVWIYYARLYQQLRKIKQINIIFFKGTSINYKTIEDYINIWTQWAEVLLEEGYSRDALNVIKHVLFRRKIDTSDLKIKNIDEILKSSALLWEFYIDLEIQIGTFETAKMAYNRCKEHKALTPLMLLNYVNMLWENAFFEEVFRVFQFAVGHFKWPNVYEIWLAYVSKFIQRYGNNGIGVERTRSIFQRLLKEVPKEKSKIFFFMYAEFEEEYGLYSHAIEIYDKMVNSVPDPEKYECYNIYISKVAKLLGITKTRAIFQSALQKLKEKEIIFIALKYAQLEKNLGQIERARGVYIYSSQFTDPRDDSNGLWKVWQDFEVQYGTKDSYKQYLRIKRSVVAKFTMLPPDLAKIEQKVNKGLI